MQDLTINTECLQLRSELLVAMRKQDHIVGEPLRIIRELPT